MIPTLSPETRNEIIKFQRCLRPLVDEVNAVYEDVHNQTGAKTTHTFGTQWVRGNDEFRESAAACGLSLSRYATRDCPIVDCDGVHILYRRVSNVADYVSRLPEKPKVKELLANVQPYNYQQPLLDGNGKITDVALRGDGDVDPGASVESGRKDSLFVLLLVSQPNGIAKFVEGFVSLDEKGRAVIQEVTIHGDDDNYAAPMTPTQVEVFDEGVAPEVKLSLRPQSEIDNDEAQA